MRISHSHKLIYLALPRTGSTTARAILDAYADITSVHISEITPDFPFYHHISAPELKTIFAARGWNWNGYRKFCVIRNPYDRIVSLYHHRVENLTMHAHRSPVSFKQYVFQLNSSQRLPTSLQAFACDESGEFLVQDILQFEQLHSQLPAYLHQIGISFSADHIPHLNASKNRRPYRDYYDAETQARVGQLYRYEIERFGYVF